MDFLDQGSDSAATQTPHQVMESKHFPLDPRAVGECLQHEEHRLEIGHDIIGMAMTHAEIGVDNSDIVEQLKGERKRVFDVGEHLTIDVVDTSLSATTHVEHVVLFQIGFDQGDVVTAEDHFHGKSPVCVRCESRYLSW